AIRQHHELVEAIIEPSASFVRSYRPVILATVDGRTHSGVISGESSTEITLRTADFAEVRIPRTDIETFKESDLSMVGAIRQHHELVEAVVEPSASFVRSYRPVLLATTDGKVHTGVIASETSTEITLRTADFNEVRINRADVETFKESDISIMPAGIDQRLTRTELADLIAFLASLKERKP
ncbi:MAG TPA: hypothetical protein VM452_19200, partial [Caulifigura sp.]|nr:hypothetical protein [Caulifigura sp.]